MTPILADLYREISPDLTAVEKDIASALETGRPAVADMVTHAARYSGKRLRPALVLMVGRSVPGGTAPLASLVRLAAVVELVHLATLVHDDVIDGASLRRSQATVNTRWSNYEAVLLGDVLFARAIHLLARLGDERSLMGLTSAVSELCEGEILQNRHRQDAGLTEGAYYEIIGAKTAILYGTGCELAAHLSSADERTVQAFQTFGFELGLAFQIIDDCLDLSEAEGRVGKTLGTDLAQGKMTLPLIQLRDRLGPVESALFQSVIVGTGSHADRVRVLQLVQETHVVDDALKRADWHVERALAAVRAVVPLESIGTLESVAQFVRSRQS